MLTCLPRGLCSWDYVVTSAAAGQAALVFNVFSEQGAINLGLGEFMVRKQGWMSGKWILDYGGQTVAEAYKPSAFFRSFEIRSGEGLWTVTAQTPFTRTFDIACGGVSVGLIRPAHWLTRRAFIECDARTPELVQLFAFWLVALMWRRSQKNNNH